MQMCYQDVCIAPQKSMQHMCNLYGGNVPGECPLQSDARKLITPTFDLMASIFDRLVGHLLCNWINQAVTSQGTKQAHFIGLMYCHVTFVVSDCLRVNFTLIKES